MVGEWSIAIECGAYTSTTRTRAKESTTSEMQENRLNIEARWSSVQISLSAIPSQLFSDFLVSLNISQNRFMTRRDRWHAYNESGQGIAIIKRAHRTRSSTSPGHLRDSLNHITFRVVTTPVDVLQLPLLFHYIPLLNPIWILTVRMRRTVPSLQCKYRSMCTETLDNIGNDSSS